MSEWASIAITNAHGRLVVEREPYSYNGYESPDEFKDDEDMDAWNVVIDQDHLVVFVWANMSEDTNAYTILQAFVRKENT